MQKIFLGLAGTAIALALLGGGYAAGLAGAPAPLKAAPAVQADRAQIESIVHDYLVQNPEILVEVQTALTARDQAAQKQQQTAVLQAEHDAIYGAPEDAIIGNPDAKTTIVEFFDYNCGYCKHALTDMQAMVQADPDLRFVMKEFPILGPDSQQAHVVAAAFKRIAPEKYAEFHMRLLGGSGRAGEASALAIATDMGVEEAAVREAMKDPAIMEEFAKTYELANKLAITGTPSYVVGDEVLSGAVGTDRLTQTIAAVRASN